MRLTHSLVNVGRPGVLFSGQCKCFHVLILRGSLILSHPQVASFCFLICTTPGVRATPRYTLCLSDITDTRTLRAVIGDRKPCQCVIGHSEVPYDGTMTRAAISCIQVFEIGLGVHIDDSELCISKRVGTIGRATVSYVKVQRLSKSRMRNNMHRSSSAVENAGLRGHSHMKVLPFSRVSPANHLLPLLSLINGQKHRSVEGESKFFASCGSLA